MAAPVWKWSSWQCMFMVILPSILKHISMVRKKANIPGNIDSCYRVTCFYIFMVYRCVLKSICVCVCASWLSLASDHQWPGTKDHAGCMTIMHVTCEQTRRLIHDHWCLLTIRHSWLWLIIEVFCHYQPLLMIIDYQWSLNRIHHHSGQKDQPASQLVW